MFLLPYQERKETQFCVPMQALFNEKNKCTTYTNFLVLILPVIPVLVHILHMMLTVLKDTLLPCTDAFRVMLDLQYFLVDPGMMALLPFPMKC